MAAFVGLMVAAPLLAEPACFAARGDDWLHIRATVLAEKRIIRGGEVLIDPAGMIACVGKRCRAHPQATRLDCPKAILSPSFINPHEHLAFGHVVPVPDTGIRYSHRHDWRKGTNGYSAAETFEASLDPALLAWTELRHLLAGETSLIGGNMARGLVRNLDFHAGLEGLETPRASYVVFPLDDGTGILRTADCNYGPRAQTSEQAAAAHALLIHLGEGIGPASVNEIRCASDPAYDRSPEPAGGGMAQDLMLGNVTVLHGIGLDHAALAVLTRIMSPIDHLSKVRVSCSCYDPAAPRVR